MSRIRSRNLASNTSPFRRFNEVCEAHVPFVPNRNKLVNHNGPVAERGSTLKLARTESGVVRLRASPALGGAMVLGKGLTGTTCAVQHFCWGM